MTPEGKRRGAAARQLKRGSDELDDTQRTSTTQSKRERLSSPDIAANRIRPLTEAELCDCVQTLSEDRLPARVCKEARDAILDDFVVHELKLSEPSTVKRAFAGLARSLQRHGILDTDTEKVLITLCEEARDGLDRLSTALLEFQSTGIQEICAYTMENASAVGTDLSRQRSTANTPARQVPTPGSETQDSEAILLNTTASVSPANTRHLPQRAGANRTVPSTQTTAYGPELSMTDVALENASRTPTKSSIASSPQSAPLRSRFFHVGARTDARPPPQDSAMPDHSEDENTDSPSQAKLKWRKWALAEEEIVMKGMRLQRPSASIAEDLMKAGFSRTAFAVLNRRSVIQKRYPDECWTEELADSAREEGEKDKAQDIKKSDLSLHSAAESVGYPTKVHWKTCPAPPADPDVHVLYLPVNTFEVPTAVDKGALEQACIEAFKGGHRSFQDVEQLAEDFWIVRCKTSQFGIRDLMECPITYKGFQFFAEYLPHEPPKTFIADVPRHVLHRELISALSKSFVEMKLTAEIAFQIDPDSDLRRLVAYFKKPPGLLRFCIALRSWRVRLSFKAVEMYATCWLCREEHGDRRCAMAIPLNLNAGIA